MGIPQADIDRVKQEVSIIDLVESYGVKLKKKGADYIGICPFHNDTHPSLVITPSKNLWNCLGACGKGGDVYAWIMEIEHVNFREAHLILSKKVPGLSQTKSGKKITQRNPTNLLDVKNQRLISHVVEFYHNTLKTSSEAHEFLEKRGIRDEEAISTFKLGYANRSLGKCLPSGFGNPIRIRLQDIGILKASGHERFQDGIRGLPCSGARYGGADHHRHRNR